MAQIKFYAGNTASWKNLNISTGGAGYDDNAIYFLTDSHQICKGGQVLAKSFEIVTTLPTVDNGKENVLYVVTSERKLYTFNGTAFIDVLSFDAEIASAVTAEEVKAVSGKAVYDFVADQLKDLTGGSLEAYVTTVETKEGENGVLTITHGSGNSTDVRLTGVVIDPSFDTETRILTLPQVDGTDLVINLGKDMVVQSGRYDAENKQIILVLNDEAATEVKIDTTGLVDTYVSGSVDTDPIKIVITDHNVSATVAVDGSIVKIVDGKITADLSNYALASAVEALVNRVETLEKTINDDTTGLVTKVASLESRMSTAEGNITDNLAVAKTYTDTAVNNLASSEATERASLKTYLENYTNTQISAALDWNQITE